MECSSIACIARVEIYIYIYIYIRAQLYWSTANSEMMLFKEYPKTRMKTT